MKKRAGNRGIDTIIVLIVFSAFALSVLMVLMLSAGVYRNISDITRKAENERTALSYVRTKVRNLDNAGTIYIAPMGGVSGGASIDALHFKEIIGGTEYKTSIYSHDGWLCELFSEASVDLSPADGMRITPVSNLLFEEHDSGAIKVISGDLSLLLTIRSGDGGAANVTSAGGGDVR